MLLSLQLATKTFKEDFARYCKKEQPTNFSENDHADKFSLSAKIQTYFLIYSVVSIKRTGCNKRTGWSKNFI